MKNILLISLLHFLFIIPGCSQPKTVKTVVPQFGITPIWQDEFDISGHPDTTKWGYALGDHGWGNNELQNYTNRLENVSVGNGILTISAIKERSGKLNYSSARLISKHLADFLYGKFEIRAKLPQGRGTWPAIWMLASQGNYGNKDWPDNGEIDIMEHVGHDPGVIHGNIHTKAFNHSIHTNKGGEIKVANVSSEFHIYGCEWSPNEVSIWVDGQKYFTFNKQSDYTWQEWPFDKPFHLILNIAVGGNWGGQQGVDDTIFPQKMEVDYVRVFPLLEQ